MGSQDHKSLDGFIEAKGTRIPTQVHDLPSSRLPRQAASIPPT